MRRYMPAALLVMVGILLGCPGEGTGTGPGGDPCDTVTTVSLTCDVQPVFTASCALSGCHAGANPQQGMNLSPGQAFANIVNVPSSEVPSLMRVRPGEPDSSYLVHKIEGVQAVGGQMPLGAVEPLPDSLVATIRTWITAGAPNN